ncbi:hypothetical protein M3N55_00085 [Roseibaca sp. V10]|uniref:Uncharacterized protein n=1 Tax=Roseinatronobacter domitianus TaxID=2940293 RepID=A0ABT0LXG4_9RHOB|nr:hypothetical protein [Roseibaca domitiana]MCL1627118.1 hypothetical protein [Roseibaca domitiana]
MGQHFGRVRQCDVALSVKNATGKPPETLCGLPAVCRPCWPSVLAQQETASLTAQTRESPGMAREQDLITGLPPGLFDQMIDLRQGVGHSFIKAFKTVCYCFDIVITDQVFKLTQFGGQRPGTKDIREPDQLMNQTTGLEVVAP